MSENVQYLKYYEFDLEKYFTKTRLKERGLSAEGVEPYAQYYSQAAKSRVFIYDIDLCKKIQPKKRKQMTEAEKELASQKRKKTMIFNRTCTYCRQFFPKKLDKHEFQRVSCEACAEEFNTFNSCSLCKKRTGYPASISQTQQVCRGCNSFLETKVFHTRVVGTYYDDDATALLRSLINNDEIFENAQVKLLRDPNSCYDANTIQVLINDQFLGYINREFAQQLAPILDFSLDSVEVYLNVEYSRYNRRHIYLLIKPQNWRNIVHKIDFSLYNS